MGITQRPNKSGSGGGTGVLPALTRQKVRELHDYLVYLTAIQAGGALSQELRATANVSDSTLQTLYLIIQRGSPAPLM